MPRGSGPGHRGSARDERYGDVRGCIAGEDWSPVSCSRCSSMRGCSRLASCPPKLLRRIALQLNIVLKTHPLYQLELSLQLVHVLLFVSEDLFEQSTGHVVVLALA